MPCGANLAHEILPSDPQELKNLSSSLGGNQGYPPRGAKGDVWGAYWPEAFNLSHIDREARVSGDVQSEGPLNSVGTR